METETITLELSKEQFHYLRNCMLIFQDAFTVSETIEESCMAILLELGKPQRKEMRGFVESMVDWSSKVQRKKPN